MLGNILQAVLSMDNTSSNPFGNFGQCLLTPEHFQQVTNQNQIQLNFLIFLILIYVIVSKLRVDASRSRESRSTAIRLARSTLTLIPLMGTEYIVFAFVIDDSKFTYRYKIDLLFISFQGKQSKTVFQIDHVQIALSLRASQPI